MSRTSRSPWTWPAALVLAGGPWIGCSSESVGSQAPVPEVGSVQVTGTSAGQAVDTDGYGVMLDRAWEGTISANGSLTISGVNTGEHEVALDGVATNCIAHPDASQVSVPVGGTATTTFDVSCHAALLVDERHQAVEGPPRPLRTGSEHPGDALASVHACLPASRSSDAGLPHTTRCRRIWARWIHQEAAMHAPRKRRRPPSGSVSRRVEDRVQLGEVGLAAGG